MRVDAFVPRINKALDAAQGLGMTVMLCPSDVVDNYVGFPQREAVFAILGGPSRKFWRLCVLRFLMMAGVLAGASAARAISDGTQCLQI